MTNYILMFFVALSGLFGALSYHFYGDKAEAESALVQVIDANTELQKSLNLQVKSCEIDNKVVAEYQAEKQVQQDRVQATISKIDALPSITSLPKKPTQAPSNEINDINIDSKLPDSVIGLLRESCIQGEGDVCTNAK